MPMSATQKKSSAPRKATGRYSLRVWSMTTSVFAASSALTAISLLVTLDCASVLMSPSSSRMLPSDSESSLRMVDSMSLVRDRVRVRVRVGVRVRVMG